MSVGAAPGFLRAYLLRQATAITAAALLSYFIGPLNAFLLLAFWNVWLAFRISRPIGRILQVLRTREPASFGVGSERVWEHDEWGEWSDIETELQKLKRALSKKSASLVRETEDVSAVMAAISDAVVAVDRRGQVMFFNSQFAMHFINPVTHSDPSSASTRALRDWVRDPAVLAAFEGVFEKRTPQAVDVKIVSKGDGIARDLMLSVQALSRNGALGVFHDVSALKRSERIRIDFVANVSHEIRTPLTAIRGYAETVLEDVEKKHWDSLQASSEKIKKNVDRLMELVRDLLDLSTLDQGDASAKLNKRAVLVAEVTDQVLSRLELKYPDLVRKVSLRLECTTVHADPVRLEQVLTNLIENALKYGVVAGSEHAPSVEWSNQGDRTVLRVKDQGPGISEEHQRRLFERFFRVDSARSSGGTGLGLAIVKHIMISHGGTVRVESTPGQGASFICEFPV